MKLGKPTTIRNNINHLNPIFYYLYVNNENSISRDIISVIYRMIHVKTFRLRIDEIWI